MKLMLKIARVLVAVSALGLLAACNTTEGIGKDVQSTGRGIEDTAKDVKKDL